MRTFGVEMDRLSFAALDGNVSDRLGGDAGLVEAGGLGWE
jgi:hypothetical protein